MYNIPKCQPEGNFKQINKYFELILKRQEDIWFYVKRIG